MVQVLCFSPTGGTKKAAQAVAMGLGGEAAWHDISSRSFRPQAISFAEGDVCLLALPCFAGRAPRFAMDRIAGMSANGAEAVLLTAYGNRAYDEGILPEMAQGVRRCGFYVRGAVAAVAQHTYCPDIAAGRPNERDMQELTEFGRRLAAQEGRPDTPLDLPACTPWREIAPSHVFPLVSGRCTGCGTCVGGCPVGAIPASAPNTTNRQACMGCMQCVRICPNGARGMGSEQREASCRMLAKAGAAGAPKPNELFMREG